MLTFGPLSVLPAFARQGVGSVLVRESLTLARAMGHRAVIILGDPLYYSRFGFVGAQHFGIGMPGRFYLDPLQALELVPGAFNNLAGSVFHEDEAFHVDEADAEIFDLDFPPREKGPSPTQARFDMLVKSRRPMDG